MEGITKGKSGIAKRWAAVNLSAILIVVMVVSFLIFTYFRNNCYNQVKTALEYEMDSFVSVDLSKLDDESNLKTRQRILNEALENFSDKSRFDLMFLNSSGSVIVSSSGFMPEIITGFSDFEAAEPNKDGYSNVNGTDGEHTAALTHLLRLSVGEVTALRMVTSLSLVDIQLQKVGKILLLVDAVILVFSLITGIYFIRSIVIPINEVAESAKKISHGDYNARIENTYRDEIGNLSETINNMAASLSETDRLKNEFISGVSHELRTPLTAIRGWAETLKMVGNRDENTFNKGMDIILSESERLSLMVEDLLDFSRTINGKLPLNMEVIDILTVVKDTADLYWEKARSKNVEIDVAMNDDEIYISGDENRLRQVFTNLLDNALKYSEPGGKIVIMEISDKDNVNISISDFGRGIPQDEIGRIFDRFYMASNSTGGTGIGLAVVKDIVDSHNGSLIYESELGQGTTATVIIPIYN